MDRVLHDVSNANRILQLTAETLLLVNSDGVCVDIDTHSDLWFLQEDFLLGKNLLEVLPKQTLKEVFPVFRQVLEQQEKVIQNGILPLEGINHYFKCIMQPYGNMVLCQYRNITERRLLQLKIESTNRELCETQKAAMIGCWKYSSTEEVFHNSQQDTAATKIKEQTIGQNAYLSFIIPEDRHAFATWLEKNLKESTEDSIEYRIRNEEDSISYIRQKAYLREEQPDGGIRLEGFIQDITELQRNRKGLSILSHAINNTRESIFATDEDGTIIFANRQFRKYHRIPDQMNLNTLKIYDIVTELNSKEAWEDWIRKLQPEESLPVLAHRPLTHRKDILALEGTFYRVTSDEGQATYWSTMHDITDRLRYEEQIKRFNRIIDITMDNLPANVIVKDIENDFRYIYFNRERNAKDVIGKNDFDFHSEEKAARKRKEDILIAQTGKEMHRVIEVKDKKGNTRILDKRKIRVQSEDFSPVIVSIEWDITELELMKRELQAEKEKAENSDKLKSAFLANMSHEIRTPLNAIVGFSRIIAESEDSDERKAYCDIVDANNERLLQLINEILDLSKIESGIIEFTYGPVRLHGLCKEVFDAHVFRSPQNVQLIYEPSNQSLIIDSDKNRIFQVFSNLIGNAFKFTTEGSISYGYKQVGREIVFHVTDTGTGIDPAKLHKVFERFVKVNNFAQGTGLGLSICKTIIERLGGNISVTSELGRGTTFTFTAPARVNEDEEVRLPVEKRIPKADIEKNTSEESDTEVISIRDIESEKETDLDTEEVDLGTKLKKYSEAEVSIGVEIDSYSGTETQRFSGTETSPEIDEPISSETNVLSETKSEKVILIAEDTDNSYALLVAILGKKYQLIRARDGMEAVILFDEIKPNLVIMDIKMPNLNGLEATKVIRELSATVPIIIQSAFANDYDRDTIEQSGANLFVSKPVSQTKMRELIKQYM